MASYICIENCATEQHLGNRKGYGICTKCNYLGACFEVDNEPTVDMDISKEVKATNCEGCKTDVSKSEHWVISGKALRFCRGCFDRMDQTKKPQGAFEL